MIRFTTDKLDALEKKVQEHLMNADNHPRDDSHKPFWQYYRQDMPDCLMVIREYREILKQIEAEKQSRQESGEDK
jgi:hypothetical protein